MRVKTWKVLDYGVVKPAGPQAELECMCGRAAMLPVRGRPVAQAGNGLIFDDEDGAIPPTIQCRKCGRIFSL